MSFCLSYSNLGSERAGIAQLVEYKLPKLGVASSNLVARSIFDFALSLRMGSGGKTVVLWDELNFFLMVIGMNR